MADELDAGNALQGDPTDIVIEAGEVVTPAPEPENVDPVLETPPEPVREHGNKGKTPWYMERINEETNKRRAVEDQLAQKAREAEESRALLERLQNGDKTVTNTRADSPDIDALVDARAARKLFDADCDSVANAWQAEAPDDFQPRLGILSNVGILPLKDGSNSEFMEDILAVDKANAHKILDMLAQNPDRALSMRQMNSRTRIAALTRMQMTETVKPATPAAAPKIAAPSKVPAPRPIVEATRPPEEMDENDMTDAQWSAWRKKQMAKAG